MPHDLRNLDENPSMADSARTHLLAQEVTDLQRATAVLDNAVDWEVGIYGTHLVLEALQSENSELRVVL